MDTNGWALVTLALPCLGLIWLALLTISIRRWRRSAGEPVFRRLANGRTRFTWGVPQDYAKARHLAPRDDDGRLTVDVPRGCPARTERE